MITAYDLVEYTHRRCAAAAMSAMYPSVANRQVSAQAAFQRVPDSTNQSRIK